LTSVVRNVIEFAGAPGNGLPRKPRRRARSRCEPGLSAWIARYLPFEAGPMTATPEQVNAFYESGFTVQPDVFSAVEVRRIDRSFDRLEATARQLGSTTMRRLAVRH
jgi:hypothetical protein